MTTLMDVIMDIPLFGEKRVPTHEMDFGDEKTVGLQVKTGKPFKDLTNHDFGFYLGYCAGQWHVGTHEIGTFRPTKLESFNTLEDLKQKWRLD